MLVPKRDLISFPHPPQSARSVMQWGAICLEKHQDYRGLNESSPQEGTVQCLNRAGTSGPGFWSLSCHSRSV